MTGFILLRFATQAAVFIGTAIFSLAVFFRVQLIGHFANLWGSDFDGGIEAAILEHWYNVLRGVETWNRTAYFYPYKDTLGYNDGFFLYGVMHAVFRTAGANVFAAAALVDMSVKAIGFAAMFVFLRRVMDCRFGFALFGATLFTLAHGSYVHSVHEQFLSVAFAPLLAWLAWEAWRALGAGRSGLFVLWGGATSLLWGAWLLTAYYMAWFTMLFACVLAVVSVPVLGRAGVRAALTLCWKWRWSCTVVVVITVLAVIPFLVVYLPKLGETGGEQWWQTFYFTPRPNDIVNLGPTSSLWGRFYPLLCPFCTRNSFEMETGITPILLWLFVAGACAQSLIFRRPTVDRTARPLLLAISVAIIVLYLMMFRWGHVTAWWLVWKLVPGASGVRVVSRLQLFLVAPIVAVAVCYLQHLSAQVPRHVVILLAGLVLLEQAEPGVTMYDQRSELASLAVPPPPSICKVFYVSAAVDSRRTLDAYRIYPHNVRAMVLSELLNLPTINGHSTFDPPDWNFADPLAPDYEARIEAYAAKHNIMGLCRLDLIARSWRGPN